MSSDQPARPIQHLWTVAQVVAVIVTITGFLPVHWFAYVFQSVETPDLFRDSFLSAIDYRLLAVGLGVAVISISFIVRHRAGRKTPAVIETPALMPVIEAIEGKPSIAVLPFVNLSDDKAQEYFADGMTEDIITGLSCDSRLYVIARNSTFVYKGQPVDIRAVGKELGVRYVLEGSIRPIGERLRITVQLIDTASGAHVWADKIDRPKAEIFDIMDEVVDGIVMALCSSLGVTEASRTQRQRPEDMQAWALCVQAEVLFATGASPETLREAEKLARRAAEIEPGYAASWALLGYLASLRIPLGLSADLTKDSEEALSQVAIALRLAPNDPVVLGYCGIAAAWAGQAAQATDYLERSLAINPNSSFARYAYGAALFCGARPGEGIAELLLFIRRSPKDPYIGQAYLDLSFCYLQLDEIQQMEQAAHDCIKHLPGFAWGYLALAMSLAAQGRDAGVAQQMRKVRQLAPSMTRQAVEDFWRHILRKPELAEKLISLTREVYGA